MFLLHIGSSGGAWLPSLCDEVGKERAPSGGAAAGRQIRQRHLLVWARLLHPAQTPEDHRGGASGHRQGGNSGEDGKGAAARLYWPL